MPIILRFVKRAFAADMVDSASQCTTMEFGFVQLTSPFNAYLLNFPADRTFERIEKLAEKGYIKKDSTKKAPPLKKQTF